MKDYEKVFTPGSPVFDPDLLIGREDDIETLEKHLRRIGTHPVLIGDRGVGKTSLLVQGVRGYAHVKVPSPLFTNFDEIGRYVLAAVGFDVQTREVTDESETDLSGRGGIGLGSLERRSKRRQVTRKAGVGEEAVTPARLFALLVKVEEKTIIAFDEFERLTKNTELRGSIVDLVKAMADNADVCFHKIVFTGIARDAEGLLGEHNSIKRSIRELYVRRLSERDLYEFLSRAEAQTGITIPHSIKAETAWESQGFPYYTHLVGLGMIDAMIKRNDAESCVCQQDYVTARKEAVQEAFRALLHKYRHAVFGLNQAEKLILGELLSLRTTARTKDGVQANLISRGSMLVDEFSRAWEGLSRQKRLIYSLRDSGQVRYVEPLLEPFIRILIGKPVDAAQLELL